MTGFSGPVSLAKDTPLFRLHLYSEPTSLSPADQKTSSAAYLLSQLHGSLLRYQDQKIGSGLFQYCKYQRAQTELKCLLQEKLNWSDGSPLTAKDIQTSLLEFLNPKTAALRADLLFPVKNAEAFYLGKAKPEQVGIQVRDQKFVVFLLKEPDPEFVYNLANPLLGTTKSPRMKVDNSEQNLFSGPYKLKQWVKNEKIRLTPNVYFHKKNSQAPDLEFVFLAEDSVALSLYEKNQLQMVRRLPTLLIPKYSKKPDFVEVPQVRFDYIGFGTELRDKPKLRMALSQSLDFDELTSLYHAKPRAGCPGLLDDWMQEKVCQNFDLETARKNAPFETSKTHLKLAYSRLGGNDHQRTMEWLQSQWLKNLKIKVQIEDLENKLFIQQLENNPPAIFRKGISLDRPTCSSALEAFRDGDPENYLRIQDKGFQRDLKTLRSTKSTAEKKRLCSKSIKYLIENNWIIPTGPIYFSLLVDPKWTGWKLNELNQLDLSELRPKD